MTSPRRYKTRSIGWGQCGITANSRTVQQLARSTSTPASTEVRPSPHSPSNSPSNPPSPQDFKYLNERQRLEPIDFPASLRSSTFLHFVCSPARALTIHEQLVSLVWSPSLAYEPIPDRCVPAELDALRRILPHLAVFSPNHEEAWAFFDVGVEEVAKRGREGIEEVARKFVEEGAGGDVVIRSGALGAFVTRKGREKGVWVPAYHTSADKVVDVTGAGNSFMVRTTLSSPGAFCVKGN